MRLRSWGALGAFAVLAALMLSVSASGADTSTATQTYVVQMLESPVVAYEGGTAGLAATKPAKGQKIDPNSRGGEEIRRVSRSQHDAALQKVGGAAKLYDYAYTYNGFAAKLTAAQKTALEKQAGVLAVSPEEMVTADTSSTPAFLGLTAPGGLWDQLGGPTAGKSGVGAGENVVIGVVDSGIWPESKSFSDRDAAGKLSYQQIPGWNGQVHAGRGLQRLDVQPEADRRSALQRLVGRRRRRRGANGRGSSPRCATTTATARTRPAPPAATTAWPRPVPQRSSAASAAWRRGPASPPTRRSGRPGCCDGEWLHRRPRCGRSIRPSPTAST